MAMTPLRRTALIAGACYLLTFASSIPALALHGPVLDDPNFILGAGSESRVLWGSTLDLVNAIAAIATAVVLFPVLKRQHEGVALGFVTSRLLEAAVVFAGVAAMLAAVTLRQDRDGSTDTAALEEIGRSLVAYHDWTFLLGPGMIPGINALLLGYLMYRSGLVPRAIPVLGFIGAPLILGSAMATLFGVYDQVSTTATLAALPVALWEFSVGCWMLFKGFLPSPVTATILESETSRA